LPRKSFFALIFLSGAVGTEFIASSVGRCCRAAQEFWAEQQLCPTWNVEIFTVPVHKITRLGLIGARLLTGSPGGTPAEAVETTALPNLQSAIRNPQSAIAFCNTPLGSSRACHVQS